MVLSDILLILKDATDKLRRIVLQVTHPQLGSTVNSIVSLMERMTDALRSVYYCITLTYPCIIS